MLLLLTQMFFSHEIHFFLLLNRRGLFETKRPSHYLEKLTLHEVFVTGAISLLAVKQRGPCCSLSHAWFPFERYTHFFNTAE
jgi:hypothetical protein